MSGRDAAARYARALLDVAIAEGDPQQVGERLRLMALRQIVQAEGTTAIPLAAERIEQLKQRLAQATGQKIAMTTSVDPSLIGGMVARIGGTVYDGTVATQLAKMREKLLQE